MNPQELEQMQAALRDLSTILFDNMARLVLAGFSREEALQLTIALQHTMMTQNLAK